jgi:uroporphyrinogen-III synthase
MTKIALITRPILQAQQTAMTLRYLGMHSHIDPMLSIEYLPVNIDPQKRYQAILLTSGNAIPALQHIQQKHIVFTVGDATANAIQYAYPELQVINANGTSQDLANLVAEKLTPQDGPLLYISGAKISFDLEAHLKQFGYEIDRVIVYDAIPAEDLSSTTGSLLHANQIHRILFYSKRTSQTFANIIMKKNMEHCLNGIHAHTLSDNVAEPLLNLPFKQINVANALTEEALITQLQDALRGT